MKDTNEIETNGWVAKGMIVLLALMLLAAIVFAVHGIREVLLPHGSIDLHAYWYSGHFVREGLDPYQAYFEDRLPTLPVHYVDGVIDRQGPVVQSGLAITPAYTPFMVLLFSAFSFLSWPTAKVVWMVVNLLLVLIIPWLVLKLLPDGENLSNVSKLFLFLSFFCLQGTRISIWTGQASLIVFTLMLLTLLTLNKNPLIPGLFLGIALGKYSLALALVLFLFYKRRYIVIGVGVAWQLVGLVLLAFIGHVSPLGIIANNIRLLFYYTDFPGIHLASLFPDAPILAITAVLLMTVGVGWVLFKQYRAKSDANEAILDFYAFTILILWSLLVAYHRAYDTAVVILFIALSLYELTHNNISLTQKKIGVVFLGIFIFTLSIPASLMGFILPANMMPLWYQLVSAAMTLVLLTALLISLWRFRLVLLL